jgi:hypothetical protein
MTKRTERPATPVSLIASLVTLVTTPNADDATKTQAIQMAYQVDLGEGRVLGAESMGQTLMASINKSTAAK